MSTKILIRKGINGFAFSACDESGKWIGNFESLEQVRQHYATELRMKMVKLKKETTLLPIDAEAKKPVPKSKAGRIFGYCRISTMKQNIQRQITNIKQKYPDAIIFEEAFTGTKVDRPKFNKLIQNVKPGDVIVFDEVSRMSRSAGEGFELYQSLYNKGIELVFIKEPYINTSVYRNAAQRQIDANVSTGKASTDKLTKAILAALNEFQMDLAREQIKSAFEVAQAEVDFLHQRTSEGVRQAIERWEREEALGIPHEKDKPGRQSGAKIETKKAKAAKEIIKKHSRDFGGTLSDPEVIRLAGIGRNAFYRYKRQLKSSEGV